ncbi:uncharacterized protein DS421_7g219270 [Arachis hypogaea]|nr:uncharacterized protein DS421_7g219270 [Arachis hypogaea]
MATSSNHLSTIPPPSSNVATCDKPVVKNGKDFTPEPEASKSKLWESQVLLPLTIDGVDSAFVGPIVSLEEANRIKSVFPVHPQRKPVAFQDSIPIGYFDSNNRLFRNSPKTNIGVYHAWLGLIGGALYFWDETSHTFHTLYGMITPTLLDVAAITGLPPLGEEILTTTRSTIGVKSIQVEIAYVPLAVMLAEGKRLCLAKLFLARLYFTLDWITAHMREKKRITNIDGPIWFFQLWLSAIFESELQPRSTQKGPIDSAIAGHRLLNLVFPDKLMSSHDKMKHFFRAFYHLPEKDHNINLTPFANCQIGQEWLTQSLTPAKVTQKESITIWSQFLTPQLFFAGFPGEDDLRTTVYMPNAVSRQFGLTQAIPSPYYLQESQSLHVKVASLEDLLHIQKDNALRRDKFHLFPFKPCLLTTYSFFSWWKNYYSSIKVAFNTCCQRMTIVLVMQEVRRAPIVKKEKTTTPLVANPPLRKSSSRLVGKKKFNFNYSSRRVKRRLEPIEVSISSNSDDEDDTSNTSDDNLDGSVISQHNEVENENTSSSDKSVSKFSFEDDVDALSPSGQLASQLQNSEILPSEQSEKQIPITSIHAQTPNVVNDLLADLKSLNEAYACSMDTQKAIVESCSTIQSHLSTEQSHTTPPTTKIVDNSIMLPLGQQLSVILSKPVLTLATDPQFKAQLSDILQTFSTTPHPETIDPLLAHLRKVYEDLYAKFLDSQAAISSYQQLTESLSKLDAALIKNEIQFAKASSMLDSSNAALQSLEEKMPSSQEAAKEARNFQTALQAAVTRLKEIFET